MTQGVIDILEAVQVQKHQRPPQHGVFFQLSQDLLHIVVEQVPVTQIGQAVVVRQLTQLPFDVFTLGNVSDNAGEGSSLKIGGVAEGHLHRRDAPTLVFSQHFDTALQAELAAMLVVNDEVLFEFLFMALEDFRRKQCAEILIQQFIFRVTEGAFYRTVGEHDVELFVNTDNRLVHCLGQYIVLPFELSQPGHQTLMVGNVPHERN